LVDVICDTSFLIVLANKPLKGIEELEAHLGKINFIVPTVVVNELTKLALSAGVKRVKEAKLASELASRFKTMQLDGESADEVILDYASKHRCMAATIDNELKKKLQRNGISVITLSRNKLIIT
jgi:hypothetical protein